MAKKTFSLFGGEWVRFSRYVVKEGYIRPQPGARLNVYNPWEEFEKAHRVHRTLDAPYTPLLQLGAKLEFQPERTGSSLLDSRFTPTEPSKRAIVEWSEAHGPLGILHSVVQTFTPVPRWERAPPPAVSRLFREGEGLQKDTPDLAKSAWCYTKSAGRWYSWQIQTVGPVEKKTRIGDVVPKYQGPVDFEPGVLLWPFAVGELGESFGQWNKEKFSGMWSKFFPDVPPKEREAYPYPRPNKEKFFRIYAEPVPAFAAWAKWFYEAVEILGNLKRGKSAATDHEKSAVYFLNALTASIGPSLKITDSALKQEWMSASLLASYAMMVIQDLTVGHKFHACLTCRTPFISDSENTRYCSPRCRRTMQKRRYRSRK